MSIEQGIEVAQWTAMNALAGMKQALGDLERVVSLIKSLNFVACAPTFTDVHVISTAIADRLVEVLGPARGIGARATIGVQSWPEIIATRAGSRSRSDESRPKRLLTAALSLRGDS